MIHLLHGRLVDRHFRHFDRPGTLAPKALAAMFDRTWRCARCRRRYERHLLLEAARPDGEAARDERLWQAIASSAAVPLPAGPTTSQPTPARRWPLAMLAVSVAAAAIVLAPRLPPSPRSPTLPTQADPVARGGADEASLGPSLHLYRTRNGGSTPVLGEIRGDEGILVAYSNPSSTLAFLMVFAVDQTGEVHWYYPSYEREGQDPAAVPIRTRALGVELGEEIRHELPGGDLRMFALFLPSPLRVLDVEGRVARGLAKTGGSVRALDRLELPQGEQTSILLEVRP